MTSLFTRSSKSLTNINCVNFLTKINSNNEKLLIKFKLAQGNLLDSKTDNIAILLNPIKSCYYDNKTTKIVLEEAGIDLIEELQNIKKMHLQGISTSDVLITGSGNIEKVNKKIKNIFHVIGKNEFNENNKIQYEHLINHYNNIFLKKEEIQSKNISFPPIIELNFPYANLKCAEIFFKDFLELFLIKSMNQNNSFMGKEKNSVKTESLFNIFTIIQIIRSLIINKKLGRGDFEKIYWILKEEYENYKEKKEQGKKIEINDHYDINMIISNHNKDLYSIYQKELTIFLEKLSLIPVDEKKWNRNNRDNDHTNLSIKKKYLSKIHKDLLVEISENQGI